MTRRDYDGLVGFVDRQIMATSADFHQDIERSGLSGGRVLFSMESEATREWLRDTLARAPTPDGRCGAYRVDREEDLEPETYVSGQLPRSVPGRDIPGQLLRSNRGLGEGGIRVVREGSTAGSAEATRRWVLLALTERAAAVLRENGGSFRVGALGRIPFREVRAQEADQVRDTDQAPEDGDREGSDERLSGPVEGAEGGVPGLGGPGAGARGGERN